jgi:hypothetical protein
MRWTSLCPTSRSKGMFWPYFNSAPILSLGEVPLVGIMKLIDIRLVAETGDHAFWMADDEQGNVVVAGHRLIRFPAGSLEPRLEHCPDVLVGVFLENHVVTLVSDEQGSVLLLPRGERVRLPETAAAGCYGTAYDRSSQKFYLLTVNSLLEVSSRSLELKITPFEHPPDASYAYYERVVAKDGCVATYRDGLGFWSPRGSFRHDERHYGVVTIVGPNSIIAADDHEAIDVYDASGRLLESIEAPPGPIHGLDTIDGQPWIAWVEELDGEIMMVGEPTGRTVSVGESEIDVLQVSFESRVSYAKMLTGDERAVYLGECNVSLHAVIRGKDCVVFGTLDGTLVLWNTRTHEVETIEMPDGGSRRNMRIVSLLWCEPRQLLFIGTRDGGVYTANVEPSGFE